MVAVPRLYEMNYSETGQSAKIIEPTKHWKQILTSISSLYISK